VSPFLPYLASNGGGQGRERKEGGVLPCEDGWKGKDEHRMKRKRRVHMKIHGGA